MEKDVHGAPLAFRNNMKYRSGTLTLSPGDTIYVYTDGVTEASNAEDKQFGRERMLEALNRDPDADPQIIDQNVHEAIAAFVQDAPQFDDTTMLCMKYLGDGGSAAK